MSAGARYIRFFCFLVAGTLALSLAACGFQPLYGTGAGPEAGVRQDLNRIYIGNIPDREGQYLRNALIDRFYLDGWPEKPAWRLDIAPVRESITDLDITKSSDATRAQLRQDTAMTLRDARTGEALLTRDIVSITSYNILSSQFTTRVSEENARQNGLDQLAAQIETRLALYFSRR